MLKNWMSGVLSLLICGFSSAALADAGLGTWVGEPRLEMAAHFGAAKKPELSIAVGMGSRFSRLSMESERQDLLLPVSGLSLSTQYGFAPLLLGAIALPRPQLAADAGESSFPWGWVIGAAAVVATVAVVANTVDDAVSDSPDSPSDNRREINVFGPSNGNGACDMPSISNGSTITVIEQDECESPLLP